MTATSENAPGPSCKRCGDTGWTSLDDGYPPEPPHYIDTKLCECPAGVAEHEKIKARRGKRPR